MEKNSLIGASFEMNNFIHTVLDIDTEYIYCTMRNKSGTVFPDMKYAIDILPKIKNQQPEILARAFSEQLIADIGHAKVKEVNTRNAAEPNPNTCASHDFCDANITMLRAFERVTGKAEHELNFESQAEMDLWNSAWTIAKQNKFFIQK